MRLHATIGVFDPNHKAATDKALGALVLRKFVCLRDSDNKPCGLKNLDIGQVEACVQDFETKHMGECKATVKRNFKNMWELSDFAERRGAPQEAHRRCSRRGSSPMGGSRPKRSRRRSSLRRKLGIWRPSKSG